MNPQSLHMAHLLAFSLHDAFTWGGTILTVVAVFALFAWYKWTQLNKSLDELFEWELGPDRDSKTDFGPASAETETQSLSNDPVGNEREGSINTTKGGGVTSRRPTL